jgi:cytochrome c5
VLQELLLPVNLINGQRESLKVMIKLYNNAINGIGVMPAKGGLMSLSDDDVKLAVDYMIDQSK